MGYGDLYSEMRAELQRAERDILASGDPYAPLRVIEGSFIIAWRYRRRLLFTGNCRRRH